MMLCVLGVNVFEIHFSKELVISKLVQIGKVTVFLINPIYLIMPPFFNLLLMPSNLLFNYGSPKQGRTVRHLILNILWPSFVGATLMHTPIILGGGGEELEYSTLSELQ